MDVLFRGGEVTAAEVQARMPDPPSYSAVRAHLRTLEEKGHVRHEARDLRSIYMPTQRPAQARRSAPQHVVDTFFGGSSALVIAALLYSGSTKLGREEIERLSEMVETSARGAPNHVAHGRVVVDYGGEIEINFGLK